MVISKRNKNSNLVLEGDFKFEISPLYYGSIEKGPELPYKTIYFNWSPECPADINQKEEEQLIENLAEKLKQDFIKFIKTK